MHQLVSKGLSLVLVCTLVLGQTAPLLAGPQDGTVVAGSATIKQESATKVGITQTSDRVAINWQSFNIGAAEHVQFYQPSASSVALNRVVGPDPSVIMGKLTANGQVFLVNPNGIIFGKGSQVDTSGLMASTHNIKNENFMAGNYLFNIPGKPGASVINEGLIRVADTGVAAFVAPSVANRGIVVAKLGKVALASANGFTLDFFGDNLLSFLVSDEVAKTAFDIQGNQLTSFVENSGRIEAQGGHVLLTAKAAEGVVHSVINQSGVIEATTVGQDKGEIILQGGKHGEVKVSGTLDASAPNGGDGGFIDTSGAKVTIDRSTKISTAAPFGQTGRWLLDPTNFTIAASGDLPPEDLAFYLGTNNVDIQTMSGGSDQGNIFVNEAVSWGGMNKLTLLAHNNIYINAPVTASGGASMRLRADSDAYGGGTVEFGSNGRLTLNGGSLGIYYNPVAYDNVGTRSGTSGNPYSSKVTLNGGSSMTAYMLVNDVDQLQSIAMTELGLSGYYALGKDIDASATSGWYGGLGFGPIGGGVPGANFLGKFYGGGHTISNLYINRPGTYNVGLFGITYGTVSNIGIVGGTFVGSTDVGSIAGRNFGTISQVYSQGATVTSVSSGGIGALSTGGIVGVNIGTISQSFSTNNVSGDVSVGGLVGQNGMSALLIGNSYATGTVTGTTDVGGLVGSNYASIMNSYSSGAVHGSTNTGGLVGAVAFGGASTNSYWDLWTSGKGTSAGGGTGLITNDLRGVNAFAPWDFTGTWLPGSVYTPAYPTLRWTTAASASALVNPAKRTKTPEPVDDTSTDSDGDGNNNSYDLKLTGFETKIPSLSILTKAGIQNTIDEFFPFGTVPDISQLSIVERHKFAAELIARNIHVDYGPLGASHRAEMAHAAEVWEQALAPKLEALKSADSLSANQVVRLVTTVSTNAIDAATTVATGGQSSIAKLGKIGSVRSALRKIHISTSLAKTTKAVKRIDEIANTLDLMSFTVGNLADIENLVSAAGRATGDNSIEQLYHEILTKDASKVSTAIFVETLGNRIKNKMLSIVAEKAIDAVTNLSLGALLEGSGPETKEIMNALTDMIPIVGNFTNVYRECESISNESNPQQAVAWADYVQTDQEQRAIFNAKGDRNLIQKLQTISNMALM